MATVQGVVRGRAARETLYLKRFSWHRFSLLASLIHLKILLVVSRFPWPPRRGDQLRAGQLISFLSSRHEVTVLAPEPPLGFEVPPDAGCRVELYRGASASRLPGLVLRAGFLGLPLQNGLFDTSHLAARLVELAPAADLTILQLVRLEGAVKALAGRPFVVDLIDSLSLNFESRALVDRPWLRPLLRFEARRLLAAEQRLLGQARGGWLVSERDRQHLAGRLPEVAGKLTVLGIAVPVSPLPHPERREPLMIFSGNLGYFVNADAARWWLDEVAPKLAARLPEARLLVAGARPGRALKRAAARAGANLVASPPDLGALLSRAQVSLAPMRCGSGVPIKILEAWAQGLPVVASPWAAAGTTAEPGRELEIADTPEEWVEALVELLCDPNRRAQLAAAGRRRLLEDYAPDVIGGRVLGAVEKVGDLDLPRG